MSFLHAIIFGNILIVLFNCVGMMTPYGPPPIAFYVVAWPTLIMALYVLSNIAV